LAAPAGQAGHYLLQVIERLRTHQDDVLSCSEPLALAYPESLAELELPPVQVLTLLAEARLLELDPLLPASAGYATSTRLPDHAKAWC